MELWSRGCLFSGDTRATDGNYSFSCESLKGQTSLGTAFETVLLLLLYRMYACMYFLKTFKAIKFMVISWGDFQNSPSCVCECLLVWNDSFCVWTFKCIIFLLNRAKSKIVVVCQVFLFFFILLSISLPCHSAADKHYFSYFIGIYDHALTTCLHSRLFCPRYLFPKVVCGLKACPDGRNCFYKWYCQINCVPVNAMEPSV